METRSAARRCRAAAQTGSLFGATNNPEPAAEIETKIQDRANAVKQAMAATLVRTEYYEARNLLTSSYPVPMSDLSGRNARFLPDFIEVCNESDLTPAYIQKLMVHFVKGLAAMLFHNFTKEFKNLGAIEYMAGQLFEEESGYSFHGQAKTWKLDPRRDVAWPPPLLNIGSATAISQ
jgi:hypothetical protein